MSVLKSKKVRRYACKTIGWAVISAVIFFTSAFLSGAPLYSALIATLVATASKTPAYPMWEFAFEKLWAS